MKNLFLYTVNSLIVLMLLVGCKKQKPLEFPYSIVGKPIVGLDSISYIANGNFEKEHWPGISSDTAVGYIIVLDSVLKYNDIPDLDFHVFLAKHEFGLGKHKINHKSESTKAIVLSSLVHQVDQIVGRWEVDTTFDNYIEIIQIHPFARTAEARFQLKLKAMASSLPLPFSAPEEIEIVDGKYHLKYGS